MDVNNLLPFVASDFIAQTQMNIRGRLMIRLHVTVHRVKPAFMSVFMNMAI